MPDRPPAAGVPHASARPDRRKGNRPLHRSQAPRRAVSEQVNRLVQVLAAALEDAVEYGLIGRNVAAGKRRRLPTSKPRRTYLDRADHIAALLDAAGELDRERSGEYRRALLSTLAPAGLRIGEALDLRWRDVELATGRLLVRQSQTDAGVRVVDMLPALRDELAALAAERKGDDPDQLVFGTSTGGKLSRSNVRQQVLAPAIKRADAKLTTDGLAPLQEG